MQKLMPWRYHLALVPTLLLVLIAVVGISRIPIIFKSPVVTPIINTGGSQSFGSGQNTVNISAGSTTQNVSGIKTFPGRNVLPQSYFQKVAGTSGGAMDVSEMGSVMGSEGAEKTSQAASSPISQTQKSVGGTAAVSSSGQSSAVYGPQGATNIQQDLPEAQNIVQSQYSQPIVSQSVPLQQTAPLSSQGTSRTGISEITGQSENISAVPQSEENSNVVMTNSLTPSVTGYSPITNAETENTVTATPSSGYTATIDTASGGSEEQAPAVSAQDIAATEETQPAPVTEQNPVNEVNNYSSRYESVSKAVQEPNVATAVEQKYDVFYRGNFSNDEKTVLEKDFISSLTKGKDVSYVSVHQENDFSVIVEVYFTDGTVGIYEYRIQDGGFVIVSSSVKRVNPIK
jgi:hypothetical protein